MEPSYSFIHPSSFPVVRSGFAVTRAAGNHHILSSIVVFSRARWLRGDSLRMGTTFVHHHLPAGSAMCENTGRSPMGYTPSDVAFGPWSVSHTLGFMNTRFLLITIDAFARHVIIRSAGRCRSLCGVTPPARPVRVARCPSWRRSLSTLAPPTVAPPQSLLPPLTAAAVRPGSPALPPAGRTLTRRRRARGARRLGPVDVCVGRSGACVSHPISTSTHTPVCQRAPDTVVLPLHSPGLKHVPQGSKTCL